MSIKSTPTNAELSNRIAAEETLPLNISTLRKRVTFLFWVYPQSIRIDMLGEAGISSARSSEKTIHPLRGSRPLQHLIED